MKRISLARFPIVFVGLLYVAIACKGPETTIVRQSPTSVTRDTVEQQGVETEKSSAAFRQINIGEINPIPTLDPLFAENASTMRALQLVYEGLVRYDQNGSIIPGLAKEWTISPDSLTYRFVLRNDIYYHDSNAFNNGLGRKLVAADVKFVFERMAKITVPDGAAQLFMNIKGFEPYYREQHEILNPARRMLSGVAGISTPNDSTVVFKLTQKDNPFLQKLAAPYAVIYPREAITDNDPTKFKAVGAGPFTFSRQRGDSLYIFAKFKDYYNSEQPIVNRVDISIQRSESSLFRRFASKNIHLIPELGLQIMGSTLNENGNLSSSYTDRFTLEKPLGKTNYLLNFNGHSDPNQQKAKLATSLFDSTDTFGNLPAGLIRFKSYGEGRDSLNLTPGDTLSITNTRDPFSRLFMAELNRKLQQQDAALKIFDIYTPTRKIGLYITHHLPFYINQTLNKKDQTLVSFSVQHRALYQNDIEKLQFNGFPWWIDLRSVAVSPVDKQ